MNVKYYTGRTVVDIIEDALTQTKTNEEFAIVRGILDRFAATKTELIRCADCRYYSGRCCLRFGKSGKPGRNDDDFCSRGEERENDREL